MSTLPNVLTALRLLAVPVMVWAFVQDHGAEGRWRWIALGLFVVAGLTDLLDGYLARRWEVVTSFGKLADPIADKVLGVAALSMLAWAGEVPWWPIAVIVVREVAVTLGRLAVASSVVIAASAGGKAKTLGLNLAIGLFLLPGMPTWVDTVALWVLIAAVALAVVSGVDYAGRIVRARRGTADSAGTDSIGTDNAGAVDAR